MPTVQIQKLSSLLLQHLYGERETWFSHNTPLTRVLIQNCNLYFRPFPFWGVLKLWAWPRTYKVSQAWLRVMSKECKLKMHQARRLSLLKIEELVFWFQTSGLALLFIQNVKCINFTDNEVSNPVLMLPGESRILFRLLPLWHMGKWSRT